MSYLMNCKKMLSVAALGVSVVFGGASLAMAETDFPTGPIKLIYGYKSGGTAYISSQALATAAEKIFGQSIVLEERPGATATVAANMVSRAKKDGYTLGVIKSTTAINAPMQFKLPYDTFKDLEFILAFGSPTAALVVRKDHPANTWQEFVELVKKEPGKVKIATSGRMSNTTLVMDYIGMKEGLKWNLIGTSGGAEAMKLLIGGQIDAYAGSGSQAIHVDQGTCKVLLDYMKTPTYEGIPTLTDIGYPELQIGEAPYIVVAPKGIPDDVRDKLVKVFTEAAKSEGFRGAVAKIYLTDYTKSGDDLVADLKKEDATFRKILMDLGRIDAQGNMIKK